MAKGKEHKKYEVGGKASVAMTKDTCVIVAAVAHPENIYDGHTLRYLLSFSQMNFVHPSGVLLECRTQLGKRSAIAPKHGRLLQPALFPETLAERFQARLQLAEPAAIGNNVCVIHVRETCESGKR